MLCTQLGKESLYTRGASAATAFLDSSPPACYIMVTYVHVCTCVQVMYTDLEGKEVVCIAL